MRSLLFLAAAVAAPAQAGILLTFNEIPNYERPAGFYNGGTTFNAGTSQATGRIGPSLGVTIDEAAIIFQAFDQCPGGGCNGIFPNTPPLGYRALYNFPRLTSLPARTTINVAAGFTGEASVWHWGNVSSFAVYRDVGGADGNGGAPVALGFVALPTTQGCTVDPNTLTVTVCGWTKYTLNFTGTARSIGLAGSGTYFDNVTLGAPGVPEPASWALLIAGFGLTGAAMRRQRRVAA